MLRELKTFLAVARHGSFAAAGLHIGLTQSAVSAQILNLEQALGIRLFDRTGAVVASVDDTESFGVTANAE